MNKQLINQKQASIIGCEIGDRQGECASLASLADVHLALGQYDQAIPYYLQSLWIAREIKNNRLEANILGTLGHVYARRKQYKLAIRNYRLALDIALETEDRFGEAIWLANLGNVYMVLADYEQAIKHYEHACTIFHLLGMHNLYEQTKKDLGEARAKQFSLYGSADRFGHAAPRKQDIVLFCSP